jgi:predicted metal-binding membrane protein
MLYEISIWASLIFSRIKLIHHLLYDFLTLRTRQFNACITPLQIYTFHGDEIELDYIFQQDRSYRGMNGRLCNK